MKQVLLYLAQVIICSGLLYGYYHLLLRNKKFHLYNRYYLLAAVVISILVPFLNIPVYFSGNDSRSAWLQTLDGISATRYYFFANAGENKTTTFFTLDNLLIFLYAIASAFILYHFIFSILKVRKLISGHQVEKIEGINFVNTTEPGTPFSFFRWLFWNKKIQLDSTDGQQIFRHELFHIRQKHSWDIIFTELITVVLWINPFFHLIKKELAAIHEFLADQFAAKENEKWNYAELLLMHLLGAPHLRFTHPFFHKQIKRRIAMITSSQKPKYQYFRKVLVLPLLIIIAALFAFTYRQKQGVNAKEKTNPVITVVEEPRPSLPQASLTDTTPGNRSSKDVKEKADEPIITKDEPVIKNVMLEAKSTDKGSRPLYVVNNVVVPKNKSIDVIKSIVPNDIKEINVLKGSDAIAKYGPDATDGVIEIITREIKELKLAEVKPDSIKKESKNNLSEIVVVGYGSKKATKEVPPVQPSEVVVTGYGTKKEIKEVPADELPEPGKEVVTVTGKQKSINETDLSKLSPLYPNPASNSITIPFNTEIAGVGEIRVQNIQGKVFQIEKADLVKGLNNLKVNVASLAAGMYIISVTDANKNLSRVYKMIKDGKD